MTFSWHPHKLTNKYISCTNKSYIQIYIGTCLWTGNPWKLLHHCFSAWYPSIAGVIWWCAPINFHLDLFITYLQGHDKYGCFLFNLCTRKSSRYLLVNNPASKPATPASALMHGISNCRDVEDMHLIFLFYFDLSSLKTQIYIIQNVYT